jgi:hypothetical protein
MRLTPLRLAGAVLILGVALGGAVFLHNLAATPTCPGLCTAGWTPPKNWRPWADPAALSLLVLGLTGAASALVVHRRTAPE